MLTTTVALTLGLASLPADTPTKDPAAAVVLNLAMAPLTMGPAAGYIYAGDPWRGLWVGLGFWGAVYGGFLGGAVVENVPVWLTAGSAHPLSILDPGPTMAAGALIGATGYLIWSSYDVFQTTERINHQDRKLLAR